MNARSMVGLLLIIACRGGNSPTYAVNDSGLVATDVAVVADSATLSASDTGSETDIGTADLSLIDAQQPDMAVVCEPQDCGPRPANVVDACSGTVEEVELLGCARGTNGQCEWVTQACPPPCIGRDCPQPCEPWADFDAGDGCNACQCPPSGIRLDSVCSRFNCDEIGCRSSADCTANGFCDFPDDECGVQGVRGVCTSLPATCEPTGQGLCGCNGEFGVNQCELWQQRVDSMPHGGCNFPNLGEAVACGPSFCISNEQYCLVQPEDPASPDEIRSGCQALPTGCEQGDCSCFEEKLPTHVCFNGGLMIIMMPRNDSL
jgi:hypothetical protein